MNADQQRFRYHISADPELGFWVLGSDCVRREPSSIDDDEIRQSRAGLVTYPSGEVLCQYGDFRNVPDGVHFMTGPNYSDDAPGFRRNLVRNGDGGVQVVHGPSRSQTGDTRYYYSTEVINLTQHRVRVTKFAPFTRGLFGIKHTQMLPAAIRVIALLIGMSGPAACANETGVKAGFEEHRVEFHNHDVKLAGSLLLPKSERPLPAVIFVHGAGPQTRERYRKQGEYFASQGIAALIYDKRGTGQSGGAYESRKPYENLVNDALAGVALLKQRREIAPSQIGMWGLSQGGYISAAAASQSKDIQFIVAVGSEVADGMLFYYRDNLFRRYGLSDTLRDVAEKAQLGADTLFFNLRDESLLSTFAPRSYPPPEEYVHPAWSRVHQPVLVMWGQLDQHQPVGESILGLKNSLAQANNQKWTMIILPQANHDLQVSETGELHRPSRGYAPGALKKMTDWVHGVIDDPARIATMKQEGSAQQAGVLSKLIRYEKLRWFGNGTVQTALWILFLISFLANTIAGVRCGLTRIFRRQQRAALPASNRVVNFKRAICALNLLILVAFTITTFLVLDQLQPNCPSVLLFLPLLGIVSTLATIALLTVLARTRHDHGWTAARRIRCALDVLCLILFLPFMFYWNLIGLRF